MTTSSLLSTAISPNRVFERWICFKDLSRRARQYELAVDLLELRRRDRDVVFGDTDESAGVDHDVRDRPIGRDDDVVDGTDAFFLVVKDRLLEDLALSAPTRRDFAQLFGGNADQRRARNLGAGDGRRHHRDAGEDQEACTFHGMLPALSSQTNWWRGG